MSRSRAVPRAPAPRRVAAAFGLAFALLLAQWLGLAHATLHGFGAPGAAPAAGAAGDAAAQPLHGLFAHADGSADCRLYDQLTHAQPLPPAPPALAPVPARAPLPTPAPARITTADGAPYAARGPPRG